MPNAGGIVIQITGDNQVDAVFRAVEKQMQQTAQQGVVAGRELAAGMDRATESAHLLNEELGLHIPRAMQKLMATTPGLATALNAAFSLAAAGGFISLIGIAIDKIPEMTDAMMGFGAASKDAFAELVKGNVELDNILKKIEEQSFEDSLLGMSGSGKDKARRDRLQKQLDDLNKQRAVIGAKAQSLNDAAPDMNESEAAVFAETGVPNQDQAEEKQAAINNVSATLAALDRQITQTKGEIQSLGVHFQHDLGDESKSAADKAHSALDSVLKQIDEFRKSPMTQIGDAAGKSFDDDIAKLQKYGKTLGLTQQQITEDIVVLLNQRGKAVQEAMDKVDAAMTPKVEPMKIDAIADPFDDLRDQFAAKQKTMQASLRDEAEQEKLIKDQGAASGASQVEIESQLEDLRQRSAAQLKSMADSMLQIAQIIQDPAMIEQAQKLEAQLEDMNVKSHTMAMQMRQDLTGALSGSIDSMISAIERGKNAFTAFADSLLQDITRILEKMFEQLVLQKAINSLMGAIFGLAGGGDSGVDLSGISDGGGLSGLGLPGSVPMFAAGGGVSGPAIVGEQGPELFIPKTPGTIIPNSALRNVNGPDGRAQQPPNLHFSIVNNSSAPVQPTSTGVTFDDQGRQWVVGIVLDDLSSNGPISQGLGVRNS